MILDVVIITVYSILMIFIGFFAARRIKDALDLYVGGLNVGGVATALSYFTTYFSSVIFVGATALGWKYGLLVLWKDVFVVLVGTLFAFIVIGPRILALSRRYGFTSIVEFLERRYSSRVVGIVASLTVFVGLYVYCISILIGMARAVEASMGLSYIISLSISFLITLVYTVLGGYIAQVWTQSIQAIFMLFMAIMLCITCLMNIGGLTRLQNELMNIDPMLATWPYRDALPLFVFFLSLGFMGIGNPALLLKFISVRDRVSLRTATLIATVTVATLTLSLNIASAATRVVLKDSVVVPDHAFIYFTKAVMPKGFDTLLVIAILSASMSTLSAILNTITQMVRDIAIKFSNRITNKEVRFFRLTTIALGVSTTLLALRPPEMLITLFGVTTAILSSVLVGPIIYGLYWRKATATGALTSIITSFILAIGVSAYGGFRFPWTYYAFIPSVITSLAVLPMVSLLTSSSTQKAT